MSVESNNRAAADEKMNMQIDLLFADCENLSARHHSAAMIHGLCAIDEYQTTASLTSNDSRLRRRKKQSLAK